MIRRIKRWVWMMVAVVGMAGPGKGEEPRSLWDRIPPTVRQVAPLTAPSDYHSNKDDDDGDSVGH